MVQKLYGKLGRAFFTRKSLPITLLAFFISTQLSHSTDYSGQSPYRLIFLESIPQSTIFNPNKDVVNVSAEDLLKENFSKKVLGAVTKGVLPMSGSLGNSLGSQEVDFLTAATSMASLFADSLNDVITSPEFRSLKSRNPYEGSVYLIPYQDESRNLFYSSEKITMTPGQVTNILMTSRTSEKFEKTVTEQIKKLQSLRANSANPVFLLGVKSSIFINNTSGCGAEIESCLKVNVLLALKPTGASGIPFTQANDQVTFERIVIPGSPESQSTANMKFVIPLVKANGSAASKAPWLEVEFGEFESFAKDTFKLKESGRQNMSPAMEGKGKNFIPLTFSFSSLKFDLENQKVEGLNVLTSLGFVSKRGRLPIGGFKVKTVNTQFEAEINKTIETEIAALEQQAVDAAEERLKYAPIFNEALTTIFGRLK